jgi:branched-chain amino acid transport system substrate-binding protein
MSTFGKIVTWIVVIAIVVWGFMSLGKKGADSKTIKIGFVGPLTGDLANMGENAKAAVSIAVDEINSSGGVLGKNLEVVYEDDVCAGASGASAVSKLVNTDRVVAVLGSLCSSATLGEAPITEAVKIPQIAYCSTSPLITNAGDYIFRDVPSDLFQAKYAAEYLIKSGKKKVALLSVKNDWGDGLAKAFTDSFKEAGGTLVFSDSFDQNAKDFKTQLQAIKSKSPDAIYFATYTDGTITLLKQASELKMKMAFFGADAWDDTKIWTELGTLGEGAMYTVVGTNTSDEFKAKMKAKLNKDDLIYCSNYAYDAVGILAAAMTRANSTDGNLIKDALYQTSYVGGVGSKSLAFDKNGDPTSANYIVKLVKDGKAIELVQ